MDAITDVNKFIHEACVIKGSKKALSEHLGVHRHTITKWMSDTGSMSLRSFVAIVRIVGVVKAFKSIRNL